MKLNAEQETVCRVFSRRDNSGHVHCRDCPMVLHPNFPVCLKTATENEAREFFDWTGYPYPKLEGRTE